MGMITFIPEPRRHKSNKMMSNFFGRHFVSVRVLMISPFGASMAYMLRKLNHWQYQTPFVFARPPIVDLVFVVGPPETRLPSNRIP